MLRWGWYSTYILAPKQLPVRRQLHRAHLRPEMGEHIFPLLEQELQSNFLCFLYKVVQSWVLLVLCGFCVDFM
jgi:hypothetical protein